MINVSVHVHVEDGGPEDADRATRGLHQELLTLDVDDVRPPQDDHAPSGAKGDAATVGTLLVDVANSTGLTGLLHLIASWVSRDPGRRITVRDSDGRELSLEGGTRAQHQRLIEHYLNDAPTDTDRSNGSAT